MNQEPTERQSKISRGRLFVVSAPSGAGKTTLCRALLAHFPDMIRSVSYTTRPPREGERNGVDYYFIDEETFRDGIWNNQWLEWARVYDNYYGTSAAFVEKNLTAGHDIVLNIDVQGAAQVLSRFPESIGIFIRPPSVDELRNRLLRRGKDSPGQVEKRVAAAEKELQHQNQYHHVVLNDDLDRAIDCLIEIVNEYHRADQSQSPPRRPNG